MLSRYRNARDSARPERGPGASGPRFRTATVTPMRYCTSRFLFLLVALPLVAWSHTGHGAAGGFVAGLFHPLGGVDHLLAMVAVGLWAAQAGGRALRAVPATFVTVMVAGAMLGMAGLAVPFIEAGILASVLILGLLITAALRLPLSVSVPLVGILALFHGHAHGAAMPLAGGALPYIAGFVVATAVLHLSGVGAGLALREGMARMLVRGAGSAIVIGGLYLSVA